MADTTGQSDAILRSAGQSLQVQRDGGYHRAMGPGGPSIGRGSKSLKTKNRLKRAGFFGAALLAILAAVVTAGIVLNGIGFTGIVIAFFAVVLAAVLFANFPKVKVPRREDLTRTKDARALVSRTELWLEHQRPALPPPALGLIDDLGVQLDALGQQLDHVDPAHPAALETRKLVGEYLPETIDAYRRIPANLRREQRAGATPDDQLVESLGRIRDEIGHVTRQLAEGSLDDLAIRNRFLDYKYGETGEVAPQLGQPNSSQPDRSN